jgi:hypothetical protein
VVYYGKGDGNNDRNEQTIQNLLDRLAKSQKQKHKDNAEDHVQVKGNKNQVKRNKIKNATKSSQTQQKSVQTQQKSSQTQQNPSQSGLIKPTIKSNPTTITYSV